MSTLFSDLAGQAADPTAGGPPPADATADEVDPDALLSNAIDALTQYVQHVGSDDIDTSTAAACLAKLQTIKANDQKAQEAASGTKPEHKAMAKTIQSIAAQVHGGGAGGY